MISLDDVLKVLFFVPASLRRGVALGVVAMPALATILVAYEDYGIREAVWSPVWLSAAAWWCFGLVILTFAKIRALPLWQCTLWSVVFLALTVAFGLSARKGSQYVYNEVGFYHSRGWSRAAKQPADTKLLDWQWEMSAVKDLTQVPVVIELRKTDRCRFEAFWPQNASADYTPDVTDVSRSGPGSARWRILKLRKPAKLLFVLRTGALGDGPPESCRPQVSIGDTP
jgi:hypothetical protein